MPRPKRTPANGAAADHPRGNSIVASAAQITRKRMQRPTNGMQEWQQEAWYFFDTCGEFRFGVQWLANACSRARLTILEEDDEGRTSEVTDPAEPEVQALADLYGGESGHPEMLSMIALHWSVPGETYIVGEPGTPAPGVDPDDVPDGWTVYSNDEIDLQKSGVWKVDRGDGHARELNSDEDDPDAAVVIRLWRPHPRKWVEPDSPARAVLPILRELETLTMDVAAAGDSRLAGAGVFLVPSEMSFTAPPDTPSTPQVEVLGEQDPFMQTLTQAMMASRQNSQSAARVVPVVVRAPGEWIGNAKHITFSTPYSEQTMELRKECIRRLALGMDSPPEVLLGLSDSNHWSAWQIDETSLKLHVEPFLEQVVGGLTERWLWPAVEGMTNRAANKSRRIGFDTSDLKLRPDRSAEAIQLHQMLAIGNKALLRETGFESGDTPTVEEVKVQLLVKVLQSGSPELVVAALEALNVPLDVAVPADAPAAQIEGPPPPEPPAEDRQPPDESQIEDAIVARSAVLASAELLVTRALERANNRANNRGKQKRPVAAGQLDTCLHDAWTAADRTALMCGVDPGRFKGALDTYTRAVLSEGMDHSPDVLARVLAEADLYA